MAAAANGKYLALFSEQGRLSVVSADFKVPGACSSNPPYVTPSLTRCPMSLPVRRPPRPSRFFAALLTQQEYITQFDVPFQLPPKQLVWCGSDAVAAYWSIPGADTIVMIGPKGNSLSYQCPSAVLLAVELDGLRIISKVLPRRHCIVCIACSRHAFIS